jgi:hypothetical protein
VSIILKPVVALDIDGSLGDWHKHFVEFARNWTGRKMPNPTQQNPGEPLHKFLGMSKSTYRECKLAFRQGGMKRFMPVYPWAPELTRQLRKMGAEVWVCTTRPYLRYDAIDPDTRHWLRRNRFQFDGLLYGEHKYNDLVKRIERERVIGVLEDLPELCAAASRLGLPVFMRDQPYNRHVDEYPRVTDLLKFYDVMLQSIIEYKEKQRANKA